MKTKQIGLPQRALEEIKKLPVSINGKLFSSRREDTYKSRQAGNIYAIVNNKLIKKNENLCNNH